MLLPAPPTRSPPIMPGHGFAPKPYSEVGTDLTDESGALNSVGKAFRELIPSAGVEVAFVLAGKAGDMSSVTCAGGAVLRR